MTQQNADPVRIEEALSRLREITAGLGPDHEDTLSARMALGQAYKESGDLLNAKEEFGVVAAVRSRLQARGFDVFEAYYSLGIAMKGLGDYQGATDQLRVALASLDIKSEPGAALRCTAWLVYSMNKVDRKAEIAAVMAAVVNDRLNMPVSADLPPTALHLYYLARQLQLRTEFSVASQLFSRVTRTCIRTRSHPWLLFRSFFWNLIVARPGRWAGNQDPRRHLPSSEG